MIFAELRYGVIAGVLAAGGLPVAAQADDAAPEAELAQTEAVLASFGDPAPPLNHVTWVRGDPVSAYDPGTVYVLDFWATWCGPCIASMPHLQDLQEKYAEQIEVIGVAIWPRPGGVPVSDFLDDPARYSGGRVEAVTWKVAEDIERRTAKAYMEATGQGGIPTVMIVDGEGRLAWIGHPMSMDEPLEQIVNGTYDLESQIEAKKQEMEFARLNYSVQQALGAQDWELVVESIDGMLEIDPASTRRLSITKYMVLRDADKLDDASAAAVYGREMVSELYTEDAQVLDLLAWQVVNPASPLKVEDRDLELAELAIERSVELTERQSASPLDTMARLRAWQERYDEAVSLMEEAIEVATAREADMYRATRDEYVEKASEN